MSRVEIDGVLILVHDYSAKDKYWPALSKHLLSHFGPEEIIIHDQVEKVLLSAFQFLVDEFRQHISKETNLKFFLYAFLLHENSIKLYHKILSGFKSPQIDENEFAMYRRILKLVLEQGCENDLEWGKFPTAKEVFEMDDKFQELLYLGTWIYTFADFIAFQKMVENCHKINFNTEGLLEVGWQYHYGVAYNQLFPLLRKDYEQGIFDHAAIPDLRSAIEKCFGIDYDYAGGVIFQLKEHFSPTEPIFQTIEPYVLPLNLSHHNKITKELATLYYDGLTISRTNKLSIEDVVYKPYSTDRYMFRPILVYKIGGVDRALVGIEKFSESIMVLGTNAVQFNALLKEWLQVPCIQNFMNQKGMEHDKLMEDQIEKVMTTKGLLFFRNLKSLKKKSGGHLRIDNAIAGEIDFIIINQKLKKIFVVEAKYNRTRYEVVGYRNDNSNFLTTYEPQLRKKTEFISKNLSLFGEHIAVVYKKLDINLNEFTVEGVFVINTPTFYMFNGAFYAITMNQISSFFEGSLEIPVLEIKGSDGSKTKIVHPYFKKPKNDFKESVTNSNN